MPTFYTYLIGWSNLSKYYYGVRYADGSHPDELMVSYFTSSKIVKSLITSEGLPDIISIRKKFNLKEKAIQWESKVLRRLNASKHPKMLNCHNGTYLTPYTSDEFKAMLMKIHGVEYTSQIPIVKNKVKSALKGRMAMYDIETSSMIYADKQLLKDLPDQYLHPSSYKYRNILGIQEKQTKRRKTHDPRIVVFDKIDEKCIKITTDDYYSNRDRYFVPASKEYRMFKGTLDKQHNGFKGEICVIDVSINQIVRVSPEIYHANPDKFYHINSRKGKELKKIIELNS